MKQIILLTIALFFGFANYAQTVVFEDNFESYAADSNLHGETYKVWEGTAYVVDSSDAYQGIKYASSDMSKNNWQLRKTLTLEAGKTYTLEIATRCQDGAKHFVNILPGDDYSYAKIECTNADWQLHTTSFTVVEGKEDVTISIYRWPKKVVNVDAFSITEPSVTAVSSFDKSELIVSNLANGNFIVSNTKQIKQLSIYGLSGRLVYSNNNVNQKQINIAASNFNEGLYVLSVIDIDGEIRTKKIRKF